MTLEEIISTLKTRPASSYFFNSVESTAYAWNPERVSDGNTYKVKATWAGKGTWQDYYCYSRLMNWEVRNTWARLQLAGNKDLIVSIPRIPGLEIKSWMGFFWDYIKHMPANQFIFPGTHDSLTGYPGGLSSIMLARTQSQTITEQLKGGCRFFDMRFLQGSTTLTGPPKIEDFRGVHSGVTVNIKIGSVLDEIKNFLTSNPSEVLAVNISLFTKSSFDSSSKTAYPFFNNLFNIGEDVFAPDKTYGDFITLCINRGLGNLIIKSGEPGSSLETLTQAGGRIMFFTDNDLAPGNNNDYFWIKKQESCTESFSREITPQQWYSIVLQTGRGNGRYLDKPLTRKNLFNYLSMTQTSGSSDSDSKELNGVLADWILYANPDTKESSRPPVYPTDNIDSSANASLVLNNFPTDYFQLPYKPYIDPAGNTQFMQNYNLIAMDFYERSPFIINCITKNLEASINLRVQPAPQKTPQALPSVPSAWIGSYTVQTRFGGEWANWSNYGQLVIENSTTIKLNGVQLNIVSVNADKVTWNCSNGLHGDFTFVASQNKGQYYWNDVTFQGQGNCFDGSIYPQGSGMLDFRAIIQGLGYTQISN